MDTVRWGIIGCGDVTEVKSGPALQQAEGSALVAVMRRDRSLAEDYARRHGVPRAYGDAGALIDDAEVDAVYIATPPSSHCELALRVASAGKPCLVEKPMARNHGECEAMVSAFRAHGVPLWVAYYRRALPRFLLVRDVLRSGEIGAVTSVEIAVHEPLTTNVDQWRLDPQIAGGGLFFDLGSHSLDLVDFFVGPISAVSGRATNTAGAYAVEDVVAASFVAGENVLGTGIWNFNSASRHHHVLLTGTDGYVRTPIFTDGDVIVFSGGQEKAHRVRNPPHVHQPLVQTIVDELRGRGRCESSGESAARTAWVMDQIG